MQKMKALVKAYPREGLWLQEVPVPEMGINDVLIRILKTSIWARTCTYGIGTPGPRRRFPCP